MPSHEPSSTTDSQSTTHINKEDAVAAAIAEEQRCLDAFFIRLDDDVERARNRLAHVQRRPEGTDPDTDDLIRRETEYHSLNEKLDRSALAELGLVFGRIDVNDDDPENPHLSAQGQLLDRRYIGRMGLHNPGDFRTLLLDWRAPQARPFYLATAVHPDGVHHRRHIRTTGRTVTGVEDEWLDGSPHTVGSARDSSAGIAGEQALTAALEAARRGHMATIVDTIQREQDAIIRDPSRGVMVVEGGPGTGKTAVALHRIAYILYTWRDQVATTGVLIIGPNRVFLDYISRVLPELGETGVVLATTGDLYPGITPTGTDNNLAREIKGSAEMVYILREAVKDYQKVPDTPVEIKVDGITLTLTPTAIRRSRTRARRSRLAHNAARAAFADHLISHMADQLADKIGADPLGGVNLLGSGDVAQLYDDLKEEPAVEDIIETMWPILTPERVLAELTCDRAFLERVAHEYDDDTLDGLSRPDCERTVRAPEAVAWTAADVALLDELSVLIGVATAEEQEKEATHRWRQHVADAQDALDILSGSANSDLDDESDAEILSAYDVIDAETLAERQRIRDRRTTAERARADRTWAYGHIVVDEAQELTDMEWRMIFRRCPSRWMTIVGDPHQTTSPAGVDSWDEAFDSYVSRRIRRHRLTVNYRTPAEIMDTAQGVLVDEEITTGGLALTSLRSKPGAVHVTPADADVKAIVHRLNAADPERSVAIVAPSSHPAALLPESRSIEELKGLEFDHMIVVHPSAIARGNPRGRHALYVAMTRATQTLTLVGELPPSDA